MKNLDHLAKFHELVRNQFQYGGQKYALNNSRESTDQLFDDHGKNWLFGTMDKYIFRFRNLERERDLLKIATYCFILYLKKGFFIRQQGLRNDVLDTTVETKEKYFPLFIQDLEATFKEWLQEGILTKIEDFSTEKKLYNMSNVFKIWSKESWEDLSKLSIFGVYYCAFLIWHSRYLLIEKHDEDIGEK